MSSALSVDLRQRVIAAIEEGMSRRQTAARFGVSASSAIRWHDQFRREGRIAPKPQGGEQRSKHIEAHADLILDALATKQDITLTELKARLKEEHGVSAGVGTLWRFFKRRRITRKKRQRMPPSRRARM